MKHLYQCAECGHLTIWSKFLGMFVHWYDGSHDRFDHAAVAVESSHPSRREP